MGSNNQGRPLSRGYTQSKMSSNQMAKIQQHHEDGRKQIIMLKSQQIPYPSTGQFTS